MWARYEDDGSWTQLDSAPTDVGNYQLKVSQAGSKTLGLFYACFNLYLNCLF